MNGRSIGTGDTAPTTFLAAAAAHGDALVLDRYRERFGQRLPYWAAERNGRLVSLYPVAPAVMAAPFFWLQMVSLNVLWPSWKSYETPVLFIMGKNVAAVFASLTGAGLLLVLKRLGHRNDLLPTLVAASLGSEMWVVASQSLWQHGPSVLALTIALGLVLSAGDRAVRLLAAGFAGGMVFACRIPSTIFVVPLAAWIAVRHGWRVGWFLAGLLAVAGLTVLYNVAWFGTWSGGITVLEARFPVTHAVSSRWSPHVLGGLAGTLLSPSRGLFIYCPWTALVVATLPFYWDRLAHQPLVALLAASLVPSAVLLSAYSTWWGGFCFGPRFWTDATPILAILLATCFAWARERAALDVLAVLYAAILVAVLVQAIGAFCYPSSWNGHPTNVDLDHGRLWDWTDNEITRCLREGVHPAVFHGLSPDAVKSAFGLVRTPVTGR